MPNGRAKPSVQSGFHRWGSRRHFAKCRIARRGDGGIAPTRMGGVPYDVGYAPSVDGSCGRVPRRAVPAPRKPRGGEIFLPAVSVLELAADFPAKCRRAPATTLSHSLGCEDDGGEHVGGGGREHRLSALRCVNLRVDEARRPFRSARRHALPPRVVRHQMPPRPAVRTERSFTSDHRGSAERHPRVPGGGSDHARSLTLGLPLSPQTWTGPCAPSKTGTRRNVATASSTSWCPASASRLAAAGCGGRTSSTIRPCVRSAQASTSTGTTGRTPAAAPRGCLRANPDALAVLRTCDRRLEGMCSPTARQGERGAAGFGLNGEFDGVFGADAMGDVCKPERAAFEKVMASAGIDPKTTAFFG